MGEYDTINIFMGEYDTINIFYEREYYKYILWENTIR